MSRVDRGSATLEVSILAPVLLLVVFTIIQVGLDGKPYHEAVGVRGACGQQGCRGGQDRPDKVRKVVSNASRNMCRHGHYGILRAEAAYRSRLRNKRSAAGPFLRFSRM